jgi:predicted transcriptional regulator
MNKLVENLLDRVADWPEDAQQELVEAAADIEARHFGVYPLSEDERAAVQEGLAQADRGEFVPDDVVAAYFAKHRA